MNIPVAEAVPEFSPVLWKQRWDLRGQMEREGFARFTVEHRVLRNPLHWYKNESSLPEREG